MHKQPEFVRQYISLRPKYKQLSEKVRAIIEEVLMIESINFHAVTCRTKEISSFSKKIDNPKYDKPFEQITDFSGVRIITYVEDDVKAACKLIEQIFEIDRENSLDKSGQLGTDRVGYKSVHYVCELPNNRIELLEYSKFNKLKFEIQIRTILQHSWAEIEHDKNYKFSGQLPDEIKRRFKLLAGSLEIADREFNQLSREIDDYSDSVKNSTEKGNLDIELNSTSLTPFIKTFFKELLISDMNITHNHNVRLLKEMNQFGLNTLEDFKNIIPDDFIDTMIENKIESINEFGLVRMIMIINDHKKYFEKSFNNAFSIWTQDGSGAGVFRHYNIIWERDIEPQYSVPFSQN